jgi:acyl carrier protein
MFDPQQRWHGAPLSARCCPVPAAIACQARIIAPFPRATSFLYGTHQMSTALTDQIYGLIAPFNKKGIALTDATTFAGDLEWDSLTVMDFVAEVEDTFDIIISMNQQAEIENVGQLVAAVEKLQG